MPPGPIEEEHGVGAAPDAARDLDEVELHRLAVGVGHGERRAGAARRADGTEQVGAFVALIGGLARARAAPRPPPHHSGGPCPRSARHPPRPSPPPPPQTTANPPPRWR